MTTITITLPEERFAKLQEMATRFHVNTEDLVRVGIEELLSRPENDIFRSAVADTLKKNAELYRRLA